MTYFKKPAVHRLYITRVCCMLYISVMQLSVVEAVAPNSPNKVIPEPCPAYKYQVKEDNGDNKCRRCSRCPKGFQVKTECNMFNDTVCEQCSSGWYNDVGGSRCKPCSGCKPGEYIRRKCSVKRNSLCRPCPRNMFSVSSNSAWCIPCKTCRRNEERLLKCNSAADTVCGDCEKDYFRVSSTGSCLLCSHCPLELQRFVVPECRDKRGFDNPDICWPGSTKMRFSNTYGIEDITGDEIVHANEEIPKKSISLTMIMSVSGTVLGALVIILIGFVCLRQHFPSRYSSLNTTGMYELSSIPLSPVIDNTNQRLPNSFNLVPDSQNSSPDYTYFSSIDRKYGESFEEIEPFKELKYSVDHYKKYIQNLHDTSPRRSQSVPAVFNSKTPAYYCYIERQGFESPGYVTNDIFLSDCKKHETL